LIAFTSCLGKPTPTDPFTQTVAWDVIPLTDLPIGHTPTITEHRLASPPHTDSSYRDRPERYVALLVVRPAEDGGGCSEIVDGRSVITRLRQSSEGRRCEDLLRG
jgi:hypothetical protein